MCVSCPPITVEILQEDLYSELTQRKEELFDNESVSAHYLEPFDELLQSYSAFVERVFDGRLDDEESIAERRKQWKDQFNALIEQIELFKKGQISAPQPEAIEAQEPTQLNTYFTVGVKPSPF